jgi:hypothetical protein
MPLLYKLGIVLAAFIALLTVVIWVAFRERRIGRGIARVTSRRSRRRMRGCSR